MRHRCYNRLKLKAGEDVLQQVCREILSADKPLPDTRYGLKMPFCEADSAWVVAANGNETVLQFDTAGSPPVTAYQYLCSGYGLMLEAQYLDEFGLYAGTIRCIRGTSGFSLSLQPESDPLSVTRMANDVFDLDWPV